MALTAKQKELTEFMVGMLPTAPAEIAQKNADWYKQWVQGEKLKVGDRRWSLVNNEKFLYEVINSVGDNLYPPEQVPAIFKRVWVEEWPEWVQPTGATDAYAEGAKVTHNGKKWISKSENNVWEPGVFGWDEYVEE